MLLASRYGPLGVYSTAIAVGAAAWLFAGFAAVERPPSPGFVVAGIVACLFVWQFGLPAPRVGLTSMERLPQVGLLLMLEPPVAAAICAAASFLWPFVSRSYSQGSWKTALLRALHNSGMTALMLLAAGAVYTWAGGDQPLTALTTAAIVPLVLLALTAQVVNVGLLALYFHFDGRDVSRIIKPVYSIIDLVFVPAGVLTALLFNAGDPAIFGLFAVLMIVFVFSFRGIATLLQASEAEQQPEALVSRARRALHGARTVDALAARILSETRVLLRFDELLLVLSDPTRGTLETRLHECTGAPPSAATQTRGLIDTVIADGQPRLVDSTEPEGSLIAVPLKEGDGMIGGLCIRHAGAQRYSRADLNLMQRLAEQIAPAVADALAFEELQRYRQTLEERVARRTEELEAANRDKERLIAALDERSRMLERESLEDALTGIANRRCFDLTLTNKMELARASGQPLALAVADLDRFKVVNDELGHLVGDEVLRQSAKLLRSHLHASELVARIGGEEFALLLPGRSRESALQLCESIRAAFARQDWTAVHPQLRVTMSIGLADWDGTSPADALIARADERLYAAKRSGRNRVEAR
jgi:diguanylate cyclase (GGDEF)-like protein